MELRSVEELMDLLYASRTVGGPADPHEHALRTAALLRRARPADKELQVAGLVAGVARLLGPEAVRRLLGERIAGLVRRHRYEADGAAPAADGDLPCLRQAAEEARLMVFDAGVLEDWRSVLEMVAQRHSPLGAVD
ncbi:hypothetical protein [Streptomyces sp. YIM S03343]